MELLQFLLSFLCLLLGTFFTFFMVPFAIFTGYKKTGVWFVAFGTVGLVIAHWLNISTVIFLSLLLLNIIAFLALYLWTIPVIRRLPKAKHTSVNGITTIEDAVNASKKTNLEGWQLVEYVQNLTAKKFSFSLRNPWDSPAKAFERGMGYCQQQTLALSEIYNCLGIDSRVVYALRCKFPVPEKDIMQQLGHSWLKVRIETDELDVCPGSVDNKPGVVNFKIISTVRTLHPFLQPFTHLGSVIVNMLLERQHSKVLDLWMSVLKYKSSN